MIFEIYEAAFAKYKLNIFKKIVKDRNKNKQKPYMISENQRL